MDCREFHAKHIEFVDDTLPIVEMEMMRGHLRVCRKCARHDTAVRRGLLVVRNLPTIEPSADFMARLNARLQQLHDSDCVRAEVRAPSLGGFTSLAAGLALAAYIALEAYGRFATPAAIRLAPVVASAPEAVATPVSSPTFAASVSTGMPVWPAVMMLEQAPLRLATVSLQDAAAAR